MRGECYLLVGGLVIGAALCETGLRCATPFPLEALGGNRVDHPVLGYIHDASLRGIDENGFRNEAALERAALVAIGDSHTYGFNVGAEDAWPQLVERALGQKVYSLGVGGYGVLHYRALLERALALRPERIVVGLFVANDLVDYWRVAHLPHWRARLGAPAPHCAARPPRVPTWEKRLQQRSAMISAIHHLVWRPLSMPLGLTVGDPGVFAVHYGAHTTYIRKARLQRHRRNMDLDDDCIRIAYEASQSFLAELAARAAGAGVQPIVLLVPSKQRVLAGWVPASEPHYDELHQAVVAERRLTVALTASMHARGIATADPLTCLRRDSTAASYPANDDGHPVAAGYRCYADAVVDVVRGGGHER